MQDNYRSRCRNQVDGRCPFPRQRSAAHGSTSVHRQRPLAAQTANQSHVAGSRPNRRPPPHKTAPDEPSIAGSLYPPRTPEQAIGPDHFKIDSGLDRDKVPQPNSPLTVDKLKCARGFRSPYKAVLNCVPVVYDVTFIDLFDEVPPRIVVIILIEHWAQQRGPDSRQIANLNPESLRLITIPPVDHLLRSSKVARL